MRKQDWVKKKKKLKVPTSVPKRFELGFSTQSNIWSDVKDVSDIAKIQGDFFFPSHSWTLLSEALPVVVLPTLRTDTPSRAV